jgi:hypothetical protein
MPTEVNAAAVRAYTNCCKDYYADGQIVLQWAKQQWPTVAVDDIEPYRLAFWVVSMRFQLGLQQ